VKERDVICMICSGISMISQSSYLVNPAWLLRPLMAVWHMCRAQNLSKHPFISAGVLTTHEHLFVGLYFEVFQHPYIHR
jgi:hypothetical protein